MAIAMPSDELFDWLLDACGLDKDASQVRRIVIDVAVGNGVKVYVEGFATEKILQVKPPDLRGAKITVLDGTSECGSE